MVINSPIFESVPTIEALGAAVRRSRKAAGLRIDVAAARCGVSVDLLSRLERGQGGVTSERLLRVLDGMGLALKIGKAEEHAVVNQHSASPLIVESVPAQQLWSEKRARQATDYARVASGEVPQSAMSAFRPELLADAEVLIPQRSYQSSYKTEDDAETPTLQR